MEAAKLKTVDDLLQSPDERVELIGGEIVKRPMARAEHGLVQAGITDETSPLRRGEPPDGWWIITEISVRYDDHQCPCHDLAGWRKRTHPSRPSGIMAVRPDWVCEIVSPGHESKDTLDLFLLLQRQQVPYYWIIWPERRALIVYGLRDGKYAVRDAVELKRGEKGGRMRLEPFHEIEIDLSAVMG
jgi:Uma2 family endonuclease